MRYVQITNNTLVIHTSLGLKKINDSHVNYFKILKLLNDNSEEKMITPLFIDNPYKFFKVFFNSTNDGIVVINSSDSKIVYSTDKDFNGTFGSLIGNYLKFKEIKEEWPEYIC